MARLYSVFEVNSYIGKKLSMDDLLNRISVRGEISNLKYHSSGHVYFSLKDDKAVMACVMFASKAAGLKFRMKEGMGVIVTGSIGVYERDGKYQLYAESVKAEGEGELSEAFRQLKEKLGDMGLFAPEYKRPIPSYASRIGIVTAETGAAVRDIINIASRRNPYAQLILYPAIVQGEYAKESIVRGIKALEKTGVDVIIVGRGGGSMEDLWAFNEEEVAMAIFDCSIPVISAVGHETDFTIADFVADLRAPTPSAAAELAVADVRELLKKNETYERRLKKRMDSLIEMRRLKAVKYMSGLKALSPQGKLLRSRDRAAATEERLNALFLGILAEKKHRFGILLEKMKARSPLDRLGGGYVYLSDEKGAGISSVGALSEGEKLRIRLRDGVAEARVEKTEKLET